MAKQDDYVRYTIRVPVDLYLQIQAAAGDKSVNAEIISRLYGSFDTHAPTITLALDMLPQGSPKMTTTMGQFLSAFSIALRDTIQAEKAAEKKARQEERDGQPPLSLAPPED